MSWVILYRAIPSETVHCIVTENAYGIREFKTRTAAEKFSEGLDMNPENLFTFVEVEDL